MSELSELSGECQDCGEYNDDCICDENASREAGEMETFGCCLDDCIMPGYHFPSECHNSQMMEEMVKEYEAER